MRSIIALFGANSTCNIRKLCRQGYLWWGCSLLSVLRSPLSVIGSLSLPVKLNREQRTEKQRTENREQRTENKYDYPRIFINRNILLRRPGRHGRQCRGGVSTMTAILPALILADRARALIASSSGHAQMPPTVAE